MTTEYLINVFLTNGDVFARKYAAEDAAYNAFTKLCRNPLVVYASLHDPEDKEIATIDNSRR